MPDRDEHYLELLNRDSNWRADFKLFKWEGMDDSKVKKRRFVRSLNKRLLLGNLILAGIVIFGWGNIIVTIIVASLWTALIATYVWLRWIL